MSMHRGAEILCGIAAQGYKTSSAQAVAAPNSPAPAGTPLKAVQTAMGSDQLSTAYTLTLSSNTGTDTFVTAQSNKGTLVVADSAGNIITWGP